MFLENAAAKLPALALALLKSSENKKALPNFSRQGEIGENPRH